MESKSAFSVDDNADARHGPLFGPDATWWCLSGDTMNLLKVIFLLLFRPTSCFLPTIPIQMAHCIPAASESCGKDSAHSTPEHVVIAGAGIIGICTAYYLQTEHGIRSTLIDPTGTIAPAASGKAGGFLAKDWSDYSPTGPLVHHSFELHQKLAKKLGAEKIQFRRLTCASIQVDPYGKNHRPSAKKLEGIEWAQADQGEGSAVLGLRSLGTEETIAQVHPKKLCESLWEECSSAGCTLRKGKVIGAQQDEHTQRLVGAKLEDGSVVEGDALLYACGPWTADIMMGIKYHSIVLPTERILNQCVFFSGCGDPEVYVRPDQTAYCTGYPEPACRIDERPGEESIDSFKIDTIFQSVRDASGGSLGGEGATPLLQQACYLPATTDSVPIMGAIPHAVGGGDGCYVATGHTCWGILMGPGTGECMANLIATGNSPTVDLQDFDPVRYRTIRMLEQ